MGVRDAAVGLGIGVAALRGRRAESGHRHGRTGNQHRSALSRPLAERDHRQRDLRCADPAGRSRAAAAGPGAVLAGGRCADLGIPPASRRHVPERPGAHRRRHRLHHRPRAARAERAVHHLYRLDRPGDGDRSADRAHAHALCRPAAAAGTGAGEDRQPHRRGACRYRRLQFRRRRHRHRSVPPGHLPPRRPGGAGAQRPVLGTGAICAARDLPHHRTACRGCRPIRS